MASNARIETLSAAIAACDSVKKNGQFTAEDVVAITAAASLPGIEPPLLFGDEKPIKSPDFNPEDEKSVQLYGEPGGLRHYLGTIAWAVERQQSREGLTLEAKELSGKGQSETAKRCERRSYFYFHKLPSKLAGAFKHAVNVEKTAIEDARRKAERKAQAEAREAAEIKRKAEIEARLALQAKNAEELKAAREAEAERVAKEKAHMDKAISGLDETLICMSHVAPKRVERASQDKGNGKSNGRSPSSQSRRQQSVRKDSDRPAESKPAKPKPPLTAERCRELLDGAKRNNIENKDMDPPDATKRAASWIMSLIHGDQSLTSDQREVCQREVKAAVVTAFMYERGDLSTAEADAENWMSECERKLNRDNQTASPAKPRQGGHDRRPAPRPQPMPRERQQPRAQSQQPKVELKFEPAPEGGRTPEQIKAFHEQVEAEAKRKAAIREAEAKNKQAEAELKAELRAQAEAKKKAAAVQPKGKGKNNRKAMVAAEQAKITAEAECSTGKGDLETATVEAAAKTATADVVTTTQASQ